MFSPRGITRRKTSVHLEITPVVVIRFRYPLRAVACDFPTRRLASSYLILQLRLMLVHTLYYYTAAAYWSLE